MDRLVEAQGYKVQMLATDPRHYGTPILKDRESDVVVGEFSRMLKSALQTVNDKQVSADHLIIQAGVAPDTVDVHDVANALAQADMSLSFTKAVVDRMVRAYQDITTAR